MPILCHTFEKSPFFSHFDIAQALWNLFTVLSWQKVDNLSVCQNKKNLTMLMIHKPNYEIPEVWFKGTHSSFLVWCPNLSHSPHNVPLVLWLSSWLCILCLVGPTLSIQKALFQVDTNWWSELHKRSYRGVKCSESKLKHPIQWQPQINLEDDQSDGFNLVHSSN